MIGAARPPANSSWPAGDRPRYHPRISLRLDHARMPVLGAYGGIFSVTTASVISPPLRHTWTALGRPTGVAATSHGSER